MKHVNVGTVIKENKMHAGKDKAFNAFVLDEESEDQLLDEMEVMLRDGGCVVDFHSCALFPERWFDLVIVLRSETSVLYDRLKRRGYSDKKRNENMECEIMQVVLDEARQSYAKDIIQVLDSNTVDDLERNVAKMWAWVKSRSA